jgi:uncharacterized protein YjiS (DUF1127 family)
MRQRPMVGVRFSNCGDRHEPDKSESLGMWRQFKHRFLAWQDGSSFRLELPNLSDDILRDIGLSRGTERFKPAMPFWVP